MDKQPTLIKTRYGFWQYQPLPTSQELGDYYSQKYYQEGKGSYAVDYLPEEIEYFRLKARLVLRQIQRINSKDDRHLLDIGCGEGWMMDAFLKSGYKVKGFDFSSHAIEKWHLHLLDHFVQGDIYTLLKAEEGKNSKFDVIILANVIEHVRDPIGLLENIRSLLSPAGVLVIIAPNDFSPLHEKILEQKIIPQPFWLSYPDHLSYFNKESMEEVLLAYGFKLVSVVAENPIDLNLFNENSNYITDRSKGKATHLYRVRGDNFLAEQGEDKLLDLYTTYGAMGVGRNLNYYCKLG